MSNSRQELRATLIPATGSSFISLTHASLVYAELALLVDSMSESENIRQSKVPRRAHVTLTQDSEVTGDSDSFVVVGHRVRKDVAQKSGLLSGLAQVDGLASLPDDLSPEDVHLWQAARLRGIFPSTDELVTIVKVSPCTDQLESTCICCHVVGVY